MKILGIDGSPRKNGNSYLIREALKAGKDAISTLETAIIQLSDLEIQCCRACESCGKPP